MTTEFRFPDANHKVAVRMAKLCVRYLGGLGTEGRRAVFYVDDPVDVHLVPDDRGSPEPGQRETWGRDFVALCGTPVSTNKVPNADPARVLGGREWGTLSRDQEWSGAFCAGCLQEYDG